MLWSHADFEKNHKHAQTARSLYIYCKYWAAPLLTRHAADSVSLKVDTQFSVMEGVNANWCAKKLNRIVLHYISQSTDFVAHNSIVCMHQHVQTTQAKCFLSKTTVKVDTM